MNSCYSHSIANTLRADRIESAKCGLHLNMLICTKTLTHTHTHTKVSLTVEIQHLRLLLKGQCLENLKNKNSFMNTFKVDRLHPQGKTDICTEEPTYIAI